MTSSDGVKMAAPMEVVVCTDSSAPLWSCVVWELHSGANLLTYRGGQAGPRGLALLNGEYLLAAQLGKNYIGAWELQRKVRRLPSPPHPTPWAGLPGMLGSPGPGREWKSREPGPRVRAPPNGKLGEGQG